MEFTWRHEDTLQEAETAAVRDFQAPSGTLPLWEPSRGSLDRLAAFQGVIMAAAFQEVIMAIGSSPSARLWSRPCSRRPGA
jgi:uncharacterized protein YigA (DUF484 family)